jgi:chromate reductase, NAD(P)H dehydrogenase (quinone)
MTNLLLISGSTRDASTNTAALRAIRDARPDAVLYDGLVGLPAFIPGADPPPPVQELSAAIRAADAVLLCTPEYAGTLPGSLKNLLDWTVGGGDLYEKPTGWITVAAENRGHGAEATLRTVLGYVGAALVDLPRIPVSRDAVTAGEITDPTLRAALADAAALLLHSARA